MISFTSDEIELLGIEYKKTLLMLELEKLCNKMRHSAEFDAYVRTLYRQSYDDQITTTVLFQREFDTIIAAEDIATMTKWVNAHLKKLPSRKPISDDIKRALVRNQSGKCQICNCEISATSSDCHVDHIVPWVLVGDELDNNLQALCGNCNEKKNANVSYMFRSMISIG